MIAKTMRNQRELQAGRKEVGGREGRSRAEEEKLEIIQTCETRGVCTRRV